MNGKKELIAGGSGTGHECSIISLSCYSHNQNTSKVLNSTSILFLYHFDPMTM